MAQSFTKTKSTIRIFLLLTHYNYDDNNIRISTFCRQCKIKIWKIKGSKTWYIPICDTRTNNIPPSVTSEIVLTCRLPEEDVGGCTANSLTPIGISLLSPERNSQIIQGMVIYHNEDTSLADFNSRWEIWYHSWGPRAGAAEPTIDRELAHWKK